MQSVFLRGDETKGIAMSQDSDIGRTPALSRRSVLEHALHADAKHKGRLIALEIGMYLLPVFVAALVVGVFLMAAR